MTAMLLPKKLTNRKLWYILFLIGTMLLLLLASSQVSEGVYHALCMCAHMIIPALFPFMVLSELIISNLECRIQKATQDKIPTHCMILGVPKIGLLAFVMGILCGFPLGVKCTSDLYRAGQLTKKEAEQLLAFCNNTGPAFLIIGIGERLLGNRSIGLILYALQILCALLTGLIMARIDNHDDTAQYTVSSCPNMKNGHGLATAIRRSTASILSVCGMIIFFSVPISFLQMLIKNQHLLCFISSFLEIGNAATAAATLYLDAPLAALIFLCNAICFGGLSVHLQASLFLEGSGLSIKKHFAGKLLQAALAASLLYLLYVTGGLDLCLTLLTHFSKTVHSF